MKYVNFVIITILLAVSLTLSIKQASALGTGFFISNDGYLLTNRHVTDSAANSTEPLTVKWLGKTYPAILVADGTRYGIDLSLLKIDTKTSCLPAGNYQGRSIVGREFTAVYYDFTNELDPLRYYKLKITSIKMKIINDTKVALGGDYTSRYVIKPPFSRAGNSGSPIIDKDNYIVSVINGGHSTVHQPNRDQLVFTNVNSFAVGNPELVTFLTPYRYNYNIQCNTPTKDYKLILNTVNP